MLYDYFDVDAAKVLGVQQVRSSFADKAFPLDPPGMQKKGCATRTPNPNREPLGDGASHHHKTRGKYAYLPSTAF
jgi:hypothetical protein